MRMRLVNGALALVFGLFVAVQYNDPDAALWMLIYGLGLFWTALAALAPRALALSPVSMLLSLSVAVAMLLCLYYWPDSPGWWRMSVWWQTETAREGIGLTILVLGLLAPVATAIGVGRNKRRAAQAAKEAAIERRRDAALAGGLPDD